MIRYRGGSRNPHTIYDGDRPIGAVFDPADRDALVKDANRGRLVRWESTRSHASLNALCVCGHFKYHHLMVAGRGHVGPCSSSAPSDTCTEFTLDADASTERS